MNFTNEHNIPLSLQVWLMMDDYDYINEPNYISATRLMKPLRQLILPPRIKTQYRRTDVSDFIASALGSSLHASIEKAWLRHETCLAKLGYPEDVIKRVLINPTKEQLATVAHPIPVYMEQRAIREITVNGVTYKVGGKFDFVAEGIVHDNKSTTCFAWTQGSKDEDYKLQGSIYRWLNPDKITEDFIRINFIFTDWQKFMAKANPNYPQSRLASKDIPLMSLEEIEKWIRNKLALFQQFYHAPEPTIPECTVDDLWMSDPQYKYYTDPTKTDGRAYRNFDTLVEANTFKSERGKGVVKIIPGTAKRCGYCDSYDVCTQRNKGTIE